MKRCLGRVCTGNLADHDKTTDQSCKTTVPPLPTTKWVLKRMQNCSLGETARRDLPRAPTESVPQHVAQHTPPPVSNSSTAWSNIICISDLPFHRKYLGTNLLGLLRHSFLGLQLLRRVVRVRHLASFVCHLVGAAETREEVLQEASQVLDGVLVVGGFFSGHCNGVCGVWLVNE
jgi:hypothetical protein